MLSFGRGLGCGPLGVLRCSISSGTLGIRLLQVDKEMAGASWVEIPKSTFAIRRNSEKDSRCQIEVDVFFNYMKSHPCEGEWNKVAPLRILSFDIECAGRKGHFPEVRQVLTRHRCYRARFPSTREYTIQ